MPDLDITCVACNQPFPFSESEQAFYEERGFQQPKRCRQCRSTGRRAQRPAGGSPRPGSQRVGNQSGGGGPRRPGPSRGGPRGRGGPPRHGGGGGGRRALAHVGGRLTYTTHCAGCGAETEVPTPVGEGRSAFCPPCFAVRGKAWISDEE